jgi:hypothetical protein
MNDRIIPVDIVELDLNELDLRMAVEDLYEQFGCSVI